MAKDVMNVSRLDDASTIIFNRIVYGDVQPIKHIRENDALIYGILSIVTCYIVCDYVRSGYDNSFVGSVILCMSLMAFMICRSIFNRIRG